MERPIDVLCEEERLRRLSERVTFDGGDSAEPARQRRARILVEEMTTLGPRLRSKSNEDRRFKAIRALEAGLHARWKAVVHEMSEGHKGPSERVRKAAEEDLERTAVPVPTPHPTIPEDIHSKLLDALEGVTVRAVVGLRGLTEVPPNVEAVTLAVLHLVSCEYLGQMGLGPEAPENWEEARRVLLKPGHFVSSLRKFPSSLEQGQVNDSNIIFAQKKLLQIGNAASTGLAEVHEGGAAKSQPKPSRVSTTGVSPRRRSSPSPTPALTGKQPVVSSKGVYVAKAQPLRPRNSLNGTASPQPTRPQAKDLEVKPPSFARSRSAGRETKSQEVVATGGSNLSFASISTAAMPTSKDFAGIRIRLDQEKKEVRQMREIERIKVQLAENLDNAQRALDLDRQMALQENMEAQQELRELKEKERQREKVMQEEDRVHDLTLEYAHQAQQISTEKEALLRSLALLRERQKAPVAGTATKAGETEGRNRSPEEVIPETCDRPNEPEGVDVALPRPYLP
eukprot:g9385.t1